MDLGESKGWAKLALFMSAYDRSSGSSTERSPFGVIGEQGAGVQRNEDVNKQLLLSFVLKKKNI